MGFKWFSIFQCHYYASKNTCSTLVNIRNVYKTTSGLIKFRIHMSPDILVPSLFLVYPVLFSRFRYRFRYLQDTDIFCWINKPTGDVFFHFEQLHIGADDNQFWVRQQQNPISYFPAPIAFQTLQTCLWSYIQTWKRLLETVPTVLRRKNMSQN